MKKYTLGILLVLMMILTGCGTSNKEEVITETTKDVEVTDRSDRYFNEQTLVIPINNGYRYTNVIQEFDEETQEYTITITIFKPIKDE